MDTQQYSNIFNYLFQQTIPSNINTPQQKRKFINLTQNFIIKNNLLYKKDRTNNTKLLKVIQRHEMEPVLYMFHNDPTAGHFSTDKMFDKIKSRYYWPQMYDDIKLYAQSCDSCQRRGKYKRIEPLHPIPVHEPFYQIGIDIVGPLPRTSQGNRYIVVAVDYLTKWPEAKALKEATAEEVSKFIYEEIICQHGCPARILSDRGSHFNNRIIELLSERFQIKHHFSTPYHPQTNGLVERFNRTLCESLAKLKDETNEWDLYIAPALFAYRTSKHSITKIEPFFLVYGRNAKLPTDDLSVTNDNLIDRIQNLVDNVPHIRAQTRERITESQSKQKRKHDAKLRKILNFNIGDKVLYYDAAKEKQWSGKLNPKWKGPYYVHEVLINGSYKLRSMEGRVLLTPVNGNLLKPYADRQNWKSLIVI
jgi:Integrase zinc binding domain/Integrase core domain